MPRNPRSLSVLIRPESRVSHANENWSWRSQGHRHECRMESLLTLNLNRNNSTDKHLKGRPLGKSTPIEWTDHTFNPWWGCTKVSPACDHCYAEAWDKRTGGDHWGPHSNRRTFGDKHWNEPLRWDRAAAEAGARRRVFCASMADVFDNAAPENALSRLWQLVRSTPWLDWQLLTKRPQNIRTMLPPDWGEGYANVWLGTTTENQEEADRRVVHLSSSKLGCGFCRANRSSDQYH